MKTLQEIIKIALPVPRQYTPEQLEKARRKALERQAAEIGMCRADCEICSGLGWVNDGSSELKMCPNVDRWQLPSAVRYGITKQEVDRLNWESIKPNGNVKPAVDEIKRCLGWGFGWVYLWGDYGIGKTLLLKIAIAEYLRMNKIASYVRMAEILDNLRESFNQNSQESDSDRLDWWATLPLLAIDEFDRMRDTGYGIERKFVLMDRRYEDACRQKSITLIASNESPDLLPGYLRDRVFDGRFSVIKIDGSTMRPVMKWN